MSNKVLRRLLLAAGGGWIIALAPGCNASGGEQENKAPADDSPVTEVVAVQKGKLGASLQLPGELLAFQQVDLYAKENSFVKKLYADVGSEVRAGQLLASLEAPELNARLAEAGSRLKSLEAVYNASKANYERLYETSKTPGTISPNDLDQALSRRNSDYAQWEAAQSAYRAIADTRSYLEIRAPFDGIISSRNVNAGAYVGPSGKGSELPLFTLQEQRRLRLVLSVPEQYSGGLNRQGQVRFTIKAFPGQAFSAGIRRMAGALDTRLRAQRIEMDLPNPDKKLLPGMIADVNIPLSGTDSTWIVPKSALVNSTERLFVIRVRKGRAEWVDVQKGTEENGRIAVYGPLNTGDTLVKSAGEETRNGSLLGKIKTTGR